MSQMTLGVIRVAATAFCHDYGRWRSFFESALELQVKHGLRNHITPLNLLELAQHTLTPVLHAPSAVGMEPVVDGIVLKRRLQHLSL